MIDISTGNISFKSGLVLKRHMRKEEVDSEHIGSIDEYGYTSILLKHQQNGEYPFWVRLYFDPDDKLASIDMGIIAHASNTDWDQWNADAEKETDAVNRCLLENELGKAPYRYNWGIISCRYDARSGSASINVQYK